MAVRQVITSDLSGKEIDEGQGATLTISDHPLLGGRTVELDIEVSEAELLEASRLSMVSVAISVPGEPSRRVILDAAAFDKLFGKSANVEAILQGARAGGMVEAPIRRRGRPAGSKNAAAPAKGPKIDYSSLEFAAHPHRGRLTEAEKETVRNNLEAINRRLESEGYPVIDPSDEKSKAKWGF